MVGGARRRGARAAAEGGEGPGRLLRLQHRHRPDAAPVRRAPTPPPPQQLLLLLLRRWFHACRLCLLCTLQPSPGPGQTRLTPNSPLFHGHNRYMMSIRHIVSQETARLADEASDRLSEEFRLRIEDRLSEAQAGVGACPPQVCSLPLFALSRRAATHRTSRRKSPRGGSFASRVVSPLSPPRARRCVISPPHLSLLFRPSGERDPARPPGAPGGRQEGRLLARGLPPQRAARGDGHVRPRHLPGDYAPHPPILVSAFAPSHPLPPTDGVPLSPPACLSPWPLVVSRRLSSSPLLSSPLLSSRPARIRR